MCAASLFDDLVGQRDYFIWNSEADHLGSLLIDDEIEFGRLLNRDVARLCAIQNLINYFGGSTEQYWVVRSVTHKPPSFDCGTASQNRRQLRGDCKRGDGRVVGRNKSIFHDVERIRLALKSVKNGCDILRAPNLVCRDFEAERASDALSLAALKHGCAVLAIKHDCQPPEMRNYITQ